MGLTSLGVRNVGRALVYLHDQGPSMLHGDLSPKNILLRAGRQSVKSPWTSDVYIGFLYE